MADSLVQPLAPGSLDIVGDVHGEIEPLRLLLNRLGYDQEGRHPDSRQLVFVGDLPDRGPDSLAVVDFVRQAVERGVAQCILGNHELNLLLGQRKYDNGWFYGEPFHDSNGTLIQQRLATEAERHSTLEFFASLPVALHRDDLRVVHAYWNDSFIDHIGSKTDTVAVHDYYADSLESYALCRSLSPVEKELSHQNENPIKLLTSGPERQAAKPFEASGKLRTVERVPWWEDYSDPVLTVFGHYSMDASNSRQQSRAVCIDYGAYKRRGSSLPYKLAALRVPEMQIACDDGTDIELHIAAKV